MNQKYEEELWGQIDILHQKSKRQQISFNYLMDMLTKFQEACANFSKAIQGILSKTHEIIEYHSTSMYDSVQKFVICYETFNSQFKEASLNIKKQMVEPVLKPTNELFKKENEYYNIYNKFRSQYNNTKMEMDKYAQKYENNMKLCENLILNSKQIEHRLYSTEDEKKKIGKSVNDAIKSAKQAEENYKNAVDNVNRAREGETKRQTEILQFYQKLDINFYEKVKSVVGLFLAQVNKINKAILTSTDFFGKSYEQISVEKDINDFISKNKAPKKVQKVYSFTPYVPISDPTQKFKMSF